MRLQVLVQNFVKQIARTVEREATERVRVAVMAALGGSAASRRPGRPAKSVFLGAGASPMRRAPARRQKQLCPYPGCKDPAAPVFGMVCKRHKDLPKALIKKYRVARRKAKEASAKKAA